ANERAALPRRGRASVARAYSCVRPVGTAPGRAAPRADRQGSGRPHLESRGDRMKGFVVREATASERDIALIAPMFDRYRQFYGKPADPKLAETFIRDRLKAKESVIFIAIPEGGSEEALGFVQLYPSFSSV